MKNEVLIDVKHLTHLFQLTKKIKVRAVDDIVGIPELFQTSCYAV